LPCRFSQRGQRPHHRERIAGQPESEDEPEPAQRLAAGARRQLAGSTQRRDIDDDQPLIGMHGQGGQPLRGLPRQHDDREQVGRIALQQPEPGNDGLLLARHGPHGNVEVPLEEVADGGDLLRRQAGLAVGQRQVVSLDIDRRGRQPREEPLAHHLLVALRDARLGRLRAGFDVRTWTCAGFDVRTGGGSGGRRCGLARQRQGRSQQQHPGPSGKRSARSARSD